MDDLDLWISGLHGCFCSLARYRGMVAFGGLQNLCVVLMHSRAWSTCRNEVDIQ